MSWSSFPLSSSSFRLSWSPFPRVVVSLSPLYPQLIQYVVFCLCSVVAVLRGVTLACFICMYFPVLFNVAIISIILSLETTTGGYHAFTSCQLVLQAMSRRRYTGLVSASLTQRHSHLSNHHTEVIGKEYLPFLALIFELGHRTAHKHILGQSCFQFHGQVASWNLSCE